MSDQAVARPYARAMFEVASAQGSVDQVRKDLAAFAGVVRESDELRRVLASPVTSDAARRGVVAEVARKLLMQKLSTNFLLLLADKRRLALLLTIVEQFELEADTAAGVVRAEAVAAVKLSAIQVNKLRTQLESMTGRKVVVTDSVDDSLMGGLVVKLEGRIYDTSVKSQILALRDNVLRI